MQALLDSQSAHPWAIAAAVVAIAVSFFVWKMFDSRLFDLDGQRIPGPDTHFGKKSFFTIMRRGRDIKQASKVMHEELFQQLGDGRIVAVDIYGLRKVILVNHPDYVKDILRANYMTLPKSSIYDKFKFMVGNGLLTSNGPLWHAHRRMISPGFEADEFKYFADVMVSNMKNMLKQWMSKPKVDFNAEIAAVTSCIICESAFGYGLEGKVDQNFMASLVLLGYELNERITELLEWTHKLHFERQRKVQKVLGDVVALINSVIVERQATRKGGKKDADSKSCRPCLLDILLDASDNSDVKLSQDDLRDHLITFFAAGHETTSSALQWTIFELCKPENKEVLSKCIAEVDRVFEEKIAATGTSDLDYSDFAKLQYIQQVCKENLRLHPSIGSLARRVADDDFKLGKYRVGKDVQVAICVYSLHRNPEFWENPEKFDPERFAKGTPLKNPFQYIPFSAGARNCIGMRFASLEMSILLAMMLRFFNISMTPEAMSKVFYEEHITSQPRNVHIDISPRDVPKFV